MENDYEIINKFNDTYDNIIELFTALSFFKTERYNEPLTPQVEKTIYDIKQITIKRGLRDNNGNLNENGIKFYEDLIEFVGYIINS